MLSFDKVLQQYPPLLQSRAEHIYKEYLQYHILEWIFDGPHAHKLCFIWGTALRLCYDNHRFSEDLDFDNTDLSYDEFDELMQYTSSYLALKWFSIQTKILRKWAYHYHIKFPDLLYDAWISPMKTSKILIQIDTHNQWVDYDTSLQKLHKFETLTMLQVAPMETLLSQKLFTVFERKRMKGRDFFDILFLLKNTQTPHWWYLWQTLDIHDPATLKQRLLDKCIWLDFDQLQADVQPFLFQPTNQSVARFVDYIQQIEFGH